MNPSFDNSPVQTVKRVLDSKFLAAKCHSERVNILSYYAFAISRIATFSFFLLPSILFTRTLIVSRNSDKKKKNGGPGHRTKSAWQTTEQNIRELDTYHVTIKSKRNGCNIGGTVLLRTWSFRLAWQFHR